MSETNINNFLFERVLQEDPHSKSVFILGRIPRHFSAEDVDPAGAPNEHAILKVEKTHFSTEEVPVLPSERMVDLAVTDRNDIYHWYFAGLRNEARFPDLKIELIYPATETHIAKMSPQNRHMIAETPEIYKMVVEPYIKSTPASRIQWVYNALEGTAEVERVVLRDEADVETGFVLLPDSKWDCKTLDTLYLQVLVLRRDIRSLRDLTRSHLPLLRNVRDRVCAVVPAKYGVQADELRIFIHYQPSYYHFHIHVTSVRYIAGPSISIGQSHLLDTVIDNIEHIAGDYYQRCTLHYVLGERHPLFERLGVPLSAEERESEETAEGKNMLGEK